MYERSVKHDSFTLERHYNASPSQVFTAWADPAIRVNWFPKAEEFEFRVDGREIIRVSSPDGMIFTSIATFQEIAPDQRIVYTFNLDMGDRRISVSIMTVEFKPEGKGTHLIYTEQGAFFDGLDSSEDHKQGSIALLNNLDIEMQRIS